MSDVDKFQVAEEAAAQRAEQAHRDRRESRAAELREVPLRTTAGKAMEPAVLALGQVHPGDNIRADLPEIQELALSIRELGLLTPLTVRPWDTEPAADGKLPPNFETHGQHYRLVAGHRRYAALLALHDAGIDGFHEVRCEVRTEVDGVRADPGPQQRFGHRVDDLGQRRADVQVEHAAKGSRAACP